MRSEEFSGLCWDILLEGAVLYGAYDSRGILQTAYTRCLAITCW